MELITASPMRDKQKLYNEWKRTLQSEDIWCQVLKFCYQVSSINKTNEEITPSAVISIYSGAISPYGVRHAMYEPNFEIATQAYANEDFKKVIRLLLESIDINGISTQTLNLLGASYRFTGEYHRALPFLILCFREDPNTKYLIGNMALCLHALGFAKINEFIEQFAIYAYDNWSKEQLQYIINNTKLK